MGGCFVRDELVDLASFAVGVEGHAGRIALYNRRDGPVLVVFGRRHLYEGVGAETVVEIVRAASRLGVRSCVLTNAAGGLSPLLQCGDIILVEETIGTMVERYRRVSRTGQSPESSLRTLQRTSAVPVVCEPSATSACLRYASILDRAWRAGVPLRSGVYAGVSGPSYETRAEIGMLRRMGADAVGMSTVLEAEEAAREGMAVVILSLVTNVLTDTFCRSLSHDEVIDAGARAGLHMRGAIEVALDVLHGSVG